MRSGSGPSGMNADDMKEKDLTQYRIIPAHLQVQLDALDGNPDTVGVPEAPTANWADARRFHGVRKESVSIRIDADILDWLRSQGRYQVEINRILRRHMEGEAN